MTLETMSILKGTQRSCQKQNICADGEFDTNQLFIRWDIIISHHLCQGNTSKNTCIIPIVHPSVRVPIQPGNPGKMKKKNWNTPGKDTWELEKSWNFVIYNENTGKWYETWKIGQATTAPVYKLRVQQ